ncbi:hypothetical protein [Nibricoccus aquaticus]|uniref:hypothetical protein n=1 Tax=Nibricoccus aquaticus TaxID=2576891 RepID=UPI001586DECE|nr:hypothetical protein [Nibricoccus aquaticus]
MRLFIASLAGAAFGLLQIIAAFALQVRFFGLEDTKMTDSDGGLAVFALLVLFEIVCVMATAMYRITPWICRLLNDDWNADRIGRAAVDRRTLLTNLTIGAVTLRRILAFCFGGMPLTSVLPGIILFAALFIPTPRVVPKLAPHSP